MIYPEKLTLAKVKVLFVCISIAALWFPHVGKVNKRKRASKKTITVNVFHDNLNSKVYKRDLTIYERYEIDKPDLKDEIGKLRKPIIKVSKEPEKSI